MSAIQVSENLQKLKECQRNHGYESCVFCEKNNKCEMQNDFVGILKVDLQEKGAILEECQKSKNIATCTACESLLNCQKRNDYVNAVYLSMNKGNGGNFDF